MMNRHFKKSTLIPFMLLALAACDGGVSVEKISTSEYEGPDLLAGKVYYDANCSTCHGDSGGNIFRPIDTDSCLTADCTDVDSLAAFIDEYMPQNDSMACTLNGEDSCALTTAAYIINGFSTDTPDPSESSGDDVQTPLARLTNDEYVNSIRTLLSLPEDSPEVEAARSSLVSESIIGGLTNDASTQTLTQLAVSGYSSMAIAATDDFLSNVVSKDDLSELLNCTVLLEGIEVTSFTRECVEEFSVNLISQAYRRPSNDEDAAIITEIYDSVISINEESSSELYDIAAHSATIQSIMQFILLSPEFLLLVELGEDDTANSNASTKTLTDYEIATRMALFLAGTLPDEELLADASTGNLGDASVRLQHAERLMNSETGSTQFATLISNWLGIDESIAGTDNAEAATAFLTNWFANEGPFSDLYQAPVTVQHTDGTETTEPVGMLGVQAFVASHTSFPTPSFITRGTFVVEQLLCEALPDDLPDDALDVAEQTPVEVFEVHAQQACATCHKVFDNYGAAFQTYDAETSLYDPSNQDFGTSFDLYDIGDITTTISTLDDLGFTMGSSERASACMTELWYRHSARRNVDADGKDDEKLKILNDAWAESSNKSMKALLRSIVTSDSFITLYL